MDDLDVSRLLTVQEAIALIDGVAVSPRVVCKPLTQARGHRLACDVRTPSDHPPFHKSLMDGYAVRSADVPQQGGASLRIVEGEVAAGSWPVRPLNAGETLPIMTGAPLPPGADGVVPIEHATLRPGVGGCQHIEIPPGIQAARHVARRGADCVKGTVVLQKGTPLGATHIAVAATIGLAALDVFARPRVAVLSTGDELVAPGMEAAEGRIYDSNSPMLVMLLESLGCEPHTLERVSDDPEHIRERLKETLMCDAAFITGGMSVGRHDHAPRLLRELGVRLHVEKLRIKPGKPFIFGETGDGSSFVFGLPGNPVSAYVCAVRLAARLLTRLAGGAPPMELPTAKTTEPLAANGSREFYQPAVFIADRRSLTPLKWKGSADVFTLAQSDALIVRPIDSPEIETGAEVQYLEFPQ